MPVFFLLGLLGVVICHVLKKKGYRCTTEPQDGEEATWADGKDAELGEGEESLMIISAVKLLSAPSSARRRVQRRQFLWFYCSCGDIV